MKLDYDIWQADDTTDTQENSLEEALDYDTMEFDDEDWQALEELFPDTEESDLEELMDYESREFDDEDWRASQELFPDTENGLEEELDYESREFDDEDWQASQALFPDTEENSLEEELDYESREFDDADWRAMEQLFPANAEENSLVEEALHYDYSEEELKNGVARGDFPPWLFPGKVDKPRKKKSKYNPCDFPPDAFFNGNI